MSSSAPSWAGDAPVPSEEPTRPAKKLLEVRPIYHKLPKNSPGRDKIRAYNAALEGYEVTLPIEEGDDLSEIAREFAGERDPEPVERELRRLVHEASKKGVRVRLDRLFRSAFGKKGAQGPKEPVARIPLVEILHPFIQDSQVWLFVPPGKYTKEDTLPNCFNCARNVNRGTDYFIQHDRGVDVFPTLLREGYDLVKPGEPLRTGDLLLYFARSDPEPSQQKATAPAPEAAVPAAEGGTPPVPRQSSWQMIHAATYIGEAKLPIPAGGTTSVVFSKDGKGEANPYRFTDKAFLEKSYFPENKYGMSAFRKARVEEGKTHEPNWSPQNWLFYEQQRGNPKSRDGTTFCLGSLLTLLEMAK